MNRPVAGVHADAPSSRTANGGLASIGRRARPALLAVLAALTGSTSQAAPIHADDLPQQSPAGEAGDLANRPELLAVLEKFRTGDYEGAFELAREVVADHPELPPAEALLARMFLVAAQSSRGPQAADWLARGRASLEMATRSRPDDPEAFLLMGDLAFQEGRTTEAGLLFEKAAAIVEGFQGDQRRKQPALERVLAGRAAVAERQQQWEQAREYLGRWLELKPANSVARYRLGTTLFALKKPDNEVLRTLDEAAAAEAKEIAAAQQSGTPREPRVPPAAVALGRLYEDRGERDKALAWMKQAVERAGDDARTRLAVARWYWDIGEFAAARPHVAAALESDSQSLSAKVLLGMIARCLGELEEAEKHFETAHFQSPGDFAASNQLVLALVEQSDDGKRRRALELAEVNARQYPQNGEAQSTLAWVYHKLGRENDAKAHFQAAAAQGRMTADAVYFLAQFQFDNGDPQRASSLLARALAVNEPFVYRAAAAALQAKVERLVKPADENAARRDPPQEPPGAPPGP